MPMALHAAGTKIEGYTSGLSFAPGESVDFHVSTDAPSYSIRIVRDGTSPEIVWEENALPGAEHPAPERAWETGPKWPASSSLEIPGDWRSGYYIVTFMTEGAAGHRDQWEHFFVVRSAKPGKTSDTLFVIPTATYHAYNNWGGNNLYEGGHRVSTLRPMMKGLITKPEVEDSRIADLGEPNEGFEPDLSRYLEKYGFPMWVSAVGWASFEGLFVDWAEGEGHRFDYATSEDLEFRPKLLDPYKLIVSVGHDEYWSWNMRDAVESRIEKGLNAAFFVGNSVYWQVRYEDGGATMVSYKNDFAQDPVFGTDREHLLTSIWSDRRIGRPENELLGLSFNYAGYTRIAGATPRSSAGYQLYRPDHWVFAGTGLRWGDQLGSKAAIAAYEIDGLRYTIDDEGYAVPTGEDGTPRDAVILAMAPAALWNVEETPQHAMGAIPDAEMAALGITGDRANWRRFARGMGAMIVFERGEGTVFNAGTTDWVWGLYYGDRRVEQITRNVLKKLSDDTANKK
jgi:hypothetical protein